MAWRNLMVYWMHCLFPSPWNAIIIVWIVYVSVGWCTVRTAGNNNRFPSHLRLGLPQCSYTLETDCTCLCLIVCEYKLWCLVCVIWMWVVPRDLVGVSKECLRIWLCVYVTKNGITVICTECISSSYLLYVSNITSQLLFSLLLLL